MVTNGNTKMFTSQSKLEKIICRAIKEHKLLRFYYESGSGKYWRKVEPYILAAKDQVTGNIFFTGYAYPSAERETKNTNDNQGQYC